MKSREILAGCVAAVLFGSAALADDGAMVTAPDVSLTPIYADAATQPAPRKPLMALLESCGVAKALDSAGINIYGFVEGSYTYAFNPPTADLIPGRVFDHKHNEPLLNQVDLTIERTVDVTQKKWDMGFRVEMLYGSDAGLVHSNGLFDYYHSMRAFGAARNTPENQLDLNQAYVTLAVPVGNGLLIQAGKFVTLLGQEVINPTGDALFSHSYLFGFAIPFTHTGVLATYALNDQWSIAGGFSRGWEQSTNDSNSALDFLGQAKFTSADKKCGVIVNVVSGPEQPGNDSNWRTVLDGVFSFTPDPNGPWSFAVNGDYGWESNVPGIGDAQWYGVAGYTGYKINDNYTINGRLEWFRDDDGSRIGVAGNFYEATLGVAWKPFTSGIGQNLLIRPEIRWDHSDVHAFDGDKDMFTAGLDIIFNF